MKNKRILSFLLFVLADVCVLTVILFPHVSATSQSQSETQTVAIKQVDATILAPGSIESENEATLHFQTGGRLSALPFKEGDTVAKGQMIAQLDTYALERQLTQALNTYRSTRDTFDQTQQNAHNNQLQANQQPLTSSAQMDKGNAINDAVQRIVDQNQASLDNSVLNVEITNYALQLATLTAPFSGTLTSEDVTSAGVNVIPTTSFSIADENALLFRANVSSSDIDYISVGSQAVVTLSGLPDIKINGFVEKIYPQSSTLSSGEVVYQVDIKSDDLKAYAKFKQSGTVLIQNKYMKSVMLLPSWVILGKQHVWVIENGKPVLKKVTVGNTINNNTEILSGLTAEDEVIIDPKRVINGQYTIL